MKYIKKFEYQQDKPQIGDYVKIYGDYFDDRLIDFFETHIGKITDKIAKMAEEEYVFDYIVEFEEELPIFNGACMGVDEDEIIEWAPAKDLFDIKKDANKYNI